MPDSRLLHRWPSRRSCWSRLRRSRYLTGRFRWLGALALAAFTLMTTFLVNRFWEMAPPNRVPTANAFFEHLGLVGGFLLVASSDR